MQAYQSIIEPVRQVVAEYPHAIPFAFLFGSFAVGKQTPLSDIDLAVYFHNISDSEKTGIEQRISLLFDEPVNILRLDDDEISPLVRLEAVSGLPIIAPDIDRLNDFILSLVHEANEYRHLMARLKRAA